MNIKKMIHKTRVKKMDKSMKDMEQHFLHDDMKQMPDRDRAKLSRQMLTPEPVQIPSLGK